MLVLKDRLFKFGCFILLLSTPGSTLPFTCFSIQSNVNICSMCQNEEDILQVVLNSVWKAIIESGYKPHFIYKWVFNITRPLYNPLVANSGKALTTHSQRKAHLRYFIFTNNSSCSNSFAVKSYSSEIDGFTITHLVKLYCILFDIAYKSLAFIGCMDQSNSLIISVLPVEQISIRPLYYLFKSFYF